MWTDLDREQVSRAAQSLSMALSMDNERNYLQQQNNAFREGLSDSLHQVKNPLQALRTYGKILQRQIANTEQDNPANTPQLLELAERLMVQSERVVDLMVPMDTLVENLEQSTRRALQPADEPSLVMVRPETPFQLLPWENETLEFARENSTLTTTFVRKPTESGSNKSPPQRSSTFRSSLEQPPSGQLPAKSSTSTSLR